MPPTNLWKHDLQYPSPLCGVDEVGRGPLVGNVVSACVILDLSSPIIGLKDSKKLTEKKRFFLAKKIKEQAIAYSIGECTAQEIDKYNILQATLTSMKKAITAKNILEASPTIVLIDGNQPIPKLTLKQKTIVKGDSLSATIAAASILAKVWRDLQMKKLDIEFPNYGFAKHKGYPTPQHIEAIKKYGYTPYHRKSFKVKSLKDFPLENM